MDLFHFLLTEKHLQAIVTETFFLQALSTNVLDEEKSMRQYDERRRQNRSVLKFNDENITLKLPELL